MTLNIMLFFIYAMLLDAVLKVWYSICNYVADNDEALNLVEGEKVYIVGKHSSEWWYVKKTTSEEEGWVPAQYLMEEAEYIEYVQKKLHEKIDKLPVFERKSLWVLSMLHCCFTLVSVIGY